ncbi:hypothetical protein HYFRA_00008506 [Hymenoscyphus fraxineus]|uniref:Genetic interactor of prohibitins 3, mitochondrial n=1 Tax=Hymenoscyphus fraxineus TaxID=746836 RepID=A0A9N9KVZ4_9HELO|nr:hypothetical protein HYFRA_00008506 [Hymenoscyphus fraxineus]
MSRSTGKLILRLSRTIPVAFADIPTFLCPGLLRVPHLPLSTNYSIQTQHSQRRFLQTSDHAAIVEPEGQFRSRAHALLPQQCPGCGALSQTAVADQAGYYNIQRRSVREYVGGAVAKGEEDREEAIVRAALANAGPAVGDLELGVLQKNPKPKKAVGVPTCDRCHFLKSHNRGVSIAHPSIRSIQDTIFESPYKYNHVYHVIDAADFPMSLVPALHKLLHLTPQRSLNRRSKTGRFYHGQKTEVSFVIQRADLLAYKKEQVDHMMPYLREVLRDALGRTGKDVRLGNVRCVSAKQGWWTKELKEEIWKRGGGGWLVGKVNVGKSQLLHSVFPKGRSGQVDSKKHTPDIKPLSLDSTNMAQAELVAELEAESREASEEVETGEDSEWTELESLDTSLLLPPAPVETNFPEMPLVSSLPGTTASPIRLPFGNGKGELIDLPGLSRGDLELYVLPEHRASLVMRNRVHPEQEVIKPGQSLLLGGGLIRITPTTPDLVFLSYPFTAMSRHVTETERKAIPTQLQTRESSIENISIPGTGEKIASAGIFHLKWDVTKERSGPLTARSAANIRPDRLPYQVFSTDILVEGVGWVELAAQVRKRRVESESRRIQEVEESCASDAEDTQKVEEINPAWPSVEVFTPGGKFIGARRPMNAWIQMENKPGKRDMKGRPRRSMKGMKKLEKQRSRSVW